MPHRPLFTAEQMAQFERQIRRGYTAPSDATSHASRGQTAPQAKKKIEVSLNTPKTRGEGAARTNARHRERGTTPDSDYTERQIAGAQNDFVSQQLRGTREGIDLGMQFTPSAPFYNTFRAGAETSRGNYGQAAAFGTMAVLPKVFDYAGKASSYVGNRFSSWATRFKENKNFKSELDWSPESWFGTRQGYGYDAEDAVALKRHIPEYHRIEQKAKADGTWLKMSDGSTWTGDPRSWVQLQSKDGQKLVSKRLFTGVNNLDNGKGVPKSDAFSTYDGRVWTADKYEHAYPYSQLMDFDNNGNINYDFGKVFEITYPRKSKILNIDAKGQLWGDINLKNVEGLSKIGNNHLVITDDIANESVRKGFDVTKINNVVEGQGKLTNDLIIHENVPRKSLLGNNGNFDFSDKNIYRMLIPTTLGGTYIGSSYKNK